LLGSVFIAGYTIDKVAAYHKFLQLKQKCDYVLYPYRFRGGMPPQMRGPSRGGEPHSDETGSGGKAPLPPPPHLQRTSIIKDRDLQEFDKLDISDGGGWARSMAEVDYNERLIFDDDDIDNSSAATAADKK